MRLLLKKYFCDRCKDLKNNFRVDDIMIKLAIFQLRLCCKLKIH